MELKNGYQNTEIGLIPNDWKISSLGNLGQFSKGSGIKKDESQSGDIPCIRYGELYTKHNNIIRNCHSFISEEVSKCSKKIKYGDILFAGSGETKEDIGKCASFIHKYEAFAGGDIIVFTPRNCSSVYLGYLLNSKEISNQKASKGQGDAVVHISANELGKIIIPVPSLNEQEVIGEVLLDIEKFIYSIQALIDKKSQIKQGVIQDLLSPKEGWIKKKLGDFLTYEQPSNYIVKSTEYNDNNSIPVLTAGKTFILGYTDEEFGVFEDCPVIIFDDFTTSTKYVDFRFKVKSSAMKILLPKNDDVDLRFIYEMIQTIAYPMGVGDHKRHWIGSYQHLEISVPPLNEQNRISKILYDLDNEITLLDKKRNKLIQIKDGMMRNLLTGKIRLV